MNQRVLVATTVLVLGVGACWSTTAVTTTEDIPVPPSATVLASLTGQETKSSSVFSVPVGTAKWDVVTVFGCQTNGAGTPVDVAVYEGGTKLVPQTATGDEGAEYFYTGGGSFHVTLTGTCPWSMKAYIPAGVMGSHQGEPTGP